MPGPVILQVFTQLTYASVRPPRLGQLLHLAWRHDCASASNLGISIDQTLIKAYSTHLTLFFFFPFKRLLRELMVRPAGRGGGGGASDARESTRVTEGVSGGGLEGRPRGPGVAVLVGREDDTSSGAVCGTRLRRPFKVGSSSAAGSPSWSESTSAEVGVVLASFLDFAGVDLLPSAFCGPAAGSGSFFGDTLRRNSGSCSDNTHRRRPRCTPRSPARF